MLIPRRKTPGLALPTLDHGQFDLAREQSERATLLGFYRGLHCPICGTYLKDFERQVDKFAERGVSSIAISSDGAERARQMADKIGASSLRIG